MLEERQAASLGTAFISGITAATPGVQGNCLPLLPLGVPGKGHIGKEGAGDRELHLNHPKHLLPA